MQNVDADNIILGQSSTQLFHDTIRALVDPGDTIGFFDPTYANYQNAVKCALKNADIEYISVLNPETWEYLSDPDQSMEELKILCSKGLKALVVPLPDNPTSQILPDDFIKNCYHILEENNAFLVIDHAYKELWFDEMPECFKWSPQDYPNLVTLHSNSKWLSSLGRRLGWVEAHKDVVNALEKLNESNILSPDTLHSMTTASFLEKTLKDNTLKDFINKTRGLYKSTSNVMIKNIEKHLGWSYLKPQGGLYTCCPTPKDEDPIEFVEKLLKQKAVLLIPGTGFGPSMQKGLRLSYGPLCYDHELIKQGIEKIEEFISKN